MQKFTTWIKRHPVAAFYLITFGISWGLGFSWSAIPGVDITAMEGSYEFRELGDGNTEVLYALRVDPAFTIPGFLRKQAEKQIVSSALRGLKKRSESTT